MRSSELGKARLLRYRHVQVVPMWIKFRKHIKTTLRVRPAHMNRPLVQVICKRANSKINHRIFPTEAWLATWQQQHIFAPIFATNIPEDKLGTFALNRFPAYFSPETDLNHAYTRKNTQVVTNLQQTCSNAVPTTCQQDVFALLVPSLSTSWQGSLLTTCYKVVELNRLVTSCSNNLLSSCNSTICHTTVGSNFVFVGWLVRGDY